MKKTLMPENPVVYVYNCGGTFEKCYGDGAGVRNFSFPTTLDTAVRDIIDRLGLANVGELYEPQRVKESLDMNDEDRAYLASRIRRDDITLAVVVHGTDTMVETARAIHESLLDGQRKDKVVVMTGALQPAMAKNSDAEFNLGGAITAIRLLQPGVYISMHGFTWRWDECEKNPVSGHFQAIG